MRFESKTGQKSGDFDYVTAKDGNKIYYQLFIPDDPIDGILIIFQGLGGGGKDDFQDFSMQISSEGFLVSIVHQRGQATLKV